MKSAFLFVTAVAMAAPAGLPVRSGPDAYAAHGEDHGVTIAAEPMSALDVRNSFSTDLRNYLVVEVGVWPGNLKVLDLSAIDFSLRTGGDRGRSPVRPVAARSIASINQKRSASRRDDIVLYPTVGMTTGTWGTGTNVGVGIGTGGNQPGPASTDRDRSTMEAELSDKALPETAVSKPVGGYLFFPLSITNKRVGTYEIEYQLDDVHVRLTVPAPK